MNQFDEWKKLIDKNEQKEVAIQTKGVFMVPSSGSMIIGTALNSTISGGNIMVYVNIK